MLTDRSVPPHAYSAHKGNIQNKILKARFIFTRYNVRVVRR